MKFRIILTLFILAACKKSDYSSVEIYGHAGNGLNIQNSVYHDNSAEAVKFALETEGVSGVEIDVHLSLDGDLWLFHDDKLAIETNGEGCISEKNYDELSNLNYKSVNKEKLVRLKDLPLNSFVNKSFLIDARHYNGCNMSAINYAAYIQALKSIASDYPACEFIVLSKFKGWLNDFMLAGFHVFYEVNSREEFLILQEDSISFDGVIVKNSNCTNDDMELFRASNKKVFIFEVRAPKSIRQALKKRPDAIITDDIRATLIEK